MKRMLLMIAGAALWVGLCGGVGRLAGAAAPAQPAAQPAADSALVSSASGPGVGPVATTRPAAADGAAATAPEHKSKLRDKPLPVPMVPKADPAVGKSPKPTQATDQASCSTADCHGEVKNYKVVHGPVNVNSCDACHRLADEKAHRFEPRRAKQELCTFCHEPKKLGDPVVHKPVADGDCMGCHNPHGGETRRFVHGTTMADLCNRCHESVTGDKKVAHGPVASGACDSCHTSHSARFPKMVNAQGTDLCYACHDQMKGQMASAKFTHKAVTDKGCLECHDVHASDHAMVTKAEPLTLCVSCHEHQKVKDSVASAKHKHSIVTKDQACLNCHTSHGSDLAKLMKKEPAQVCMSCHDKDQDAGGGRKVLAVAGVTDPAMFKHGPIREGNCGGCHDAHGSNQQSLLAKPYSTAFYQPYSQEKYDLCFSCHDKSLVQTPKAKGLTGFRNGEQNLHFVHVAKTDKGRNCRSCHLTHASPKELHIRETVQYGKWEMPINFKRSTTGGSCSPGCHKPFDYDREKPVTYPPPAAAVGGRAVGVPAATQPGR